MAPDGCAERGADACLRARAHRFGYFQRTVSRLRIWREEDSDGLFQELKAAVDVYMAQIGRLCTARFEVGPRAGPPPPERRAAGRGRRRRARVGMVWEDSAMFGGAHGRIRERPNPPPPAQAPARPTVGPDGPQALMPPPPPPPPPFLISCALPMVASALLSIRPCPRAQGRAAGGDAMLLAPIDARQHLKGHAHWDTGVIIH